MALHFQDAWLLCLISLSTALLSEGLTYFFVYRKKHYSSLRKKIETTFYQVEDLKRSGTDEKKRKRLEKEMKEDNTKLMGMRMYSFIFLGISSFVLYQILRKSYTGVIVAKLPFVPFSLLTKMSHSGLAGSDMTDCSFGFLYALTTMSFRANITKLMGQSTPSDTGSMFQQVMDKQKALLKED